MYGSDGRYNKEKLTGKMRQGRATYRTIEKGLSDNVTFEQTLLISAFLVAKGTPKAGGGARSVCSQKGEEANTAKEEGGRDRSHGPC